AEGAWRAIGDVAYPNLNVRVRDRQVIYGDEITAQVTYKRVGSYFEYVGGADFQASPYHAGAFLRVYDQKREDGKLTYHVVGQACPDLLLALKKSQLKNGRPVGKHAHVSDALGYALWWLEPRPKARTGVPKVGTVDIRPERGNWF